MTDLAWLIYWADILPNLKGVTTALCLISVILTFPFLFVALNMVIVEEKSKRWFFLPTSSILALVIWVSIGAFIPSKETIYLMAGANTLPSIAESQEVRKVRTIINQKLDGLLDIEEEITEETNQ